MAVRRNQAGLSSGDWDKLIAAIDQLHGTQAAPPAYRDFVGLHVDAMSSGPGMAWEVHTMQNMHVSGRNFLAWHRRYILSFEQRLQQVDPSVALPYWDWVKDRNVPAPLADPAVLRRWSVTRGVFDASLLPTPGLVRQVLALTPFATFQAMLEGIHGGAHNAVGGVMKGSRSPTDPLFFLHHANVDRLWAKWQAGPNGLDPSNIADSLKPRGLIITGKVSDVLDIAVLGYSYA